MQEGGMARLGKIICRTHLQAPYNTVHVIPNGEDNDRHVPQVVIGLEMREQLMAIHLRHEEIKQYKITRLRPQHL
jgi:hypothetical protein